MPVLHQRIPPQNSRVQLSGRDSGARRTAQRYLAFSAARATSDKAGRALSGRRAVATWTAAAQSPDTLPPQQDLAKELQGLSLEVQVPAGRVMIR